MLSQNSEPSTLIIYQSIIKCKKKLLPFCFYPGCNIFSPFLTIWDSSWHFIRISFSISSSLCFCWSISSRRSWASCFWASSSCRLAVSLSRSFCISYHIPNSSIYFMYMQDSKQRHLLAPYRNILSFIVCREIKQDHILQNVQLEKKINQNICIKGVAPIDQWIISTHLHLCTLMPNGLLCLSNVLFKGIFLSETHTHTYILCLYNNNKWENSI